MRALVAWADDRSNNLGVRALAQGSTALLRRVWPGIDVEYQNFGRGAAPMPLGRFRAMARERVTGRHGLRDWLTGYDLVFDTRSGDSLADIYGSRRLLRMTAFATLAAEVGVPVVLAPQTIGPFHTVRGRMLARWTLRSASTVMVRDRESAACAARLGRQPDVHTTDVVFALPAPVVPRTRGVVLNVSGLLWQPSPHVDASGYRRTVRDLLAALHGEGHSVTLLAHVLDSPLADNDVPAIHEISREYPALEVVIPADLREARDVVASATVVVGSRMHACLNALSVGTPAIPLAYSRKFAPLLSDLQWERTVDLRTAAHPVADVLSHLQAPGLNGEALDVGRRAQVALARAESALLGALS